MNNPLMTIVTVTYYNDFGLLERQLKSMQEFLQGNFLHYVILNDDYGYMPQLKLIVAKFDKLNVVVLDKSNVCANLTDHHGWHDQQILKLEIARLIGTEYYLILDSKDYLIESFTPLSLINGERYVGSTEFADVMQSTGSHSHGAYRIYLFWSYAIFNLVAKPGIPVMRTHTPAIFKTKHVLSMLEHLYTRGIQLKDIIGISILLERDVACCEFFLYSAWLTKNNLLDEVMWNNETVVVPEIAFTYDHKRN